MSAEDRERLKEKEKAHLRELQRLKRMARQVRRSSTIDQALGNITSTAADVLNTHDEITTQLTKEAALSEARLEIALENMPELDPSLPKPVHVEKTELPTPAKTPAATKTIGPNLRTRTPDTDPT